MRNSERAGNIGVTHTFVVNIIFRFFGKPHFMRLAKIKKGFCGKQRREPFRKKTVSQQTFEYLIL